MQHDHRYRHDLTALKTPQHLPLPPTCNELGGCRRVCPHPILMITEGTRAPCSRRHQFRGSRLPIPVFRNLFFGSKKLFLTGFLRISFFPAFSGGIFHRKVVLERSQESVFFRFYRNFSQEFLWAGIPVFTQDSSGFLRIPPDSCSRQKLSGVGQ